MTHKTGFKAIIGVAAGLFLGLSAAAFAHNGGFQGQHRGAGMMGQACPWNTTAQGGAGQMHQQAFHQGMHGMMYNQAVNQNTQRQTRGPGALQGAPCGLNPQCPALQADTDTTTP